MSLLGDSKEQVSKDEWVVWPSSEKPLTSVCQTGAKKGGNLARNSVPS